MLKNLISIFFILLGQTAFASYGPCPKGIFDNSNAVETVNFLQAHEGRFQLGKCSVEIRVCDLNNKDVVDENGSMAADMLIIDSDGFQRYIPFFISEFQNRWSKQVMLQTKAALVYRFNDNNYDPETGKDERWDIEFVNKPDLETIDYIEVGYSSEVERKNEVNKKWIACGTEREEYLKHHPHMHNLKSVWWWITHPESR